MALPVYPATGIGEVPFLSRAETWAHRRRATGGGRISAWVWTFRRTGRQRTVLRGTSF